MAFSQAGADAYMTIGRINCEALVARAALDRAGRGTQLYAFSTNSETPNAYFDRTATDIRKAQTGQKLLVGNAAEMATRSLIDIQEGVDVVLQKPFENFHAISIVRRLIDGTLAVAELRRQPRVQALISANPELFSEGLIETPLARKRLRKAAIGGYEVSGSYAISRMIEDRYGPALAWALLHEAFC